MRPAATSRLSALRKLKVAQAWSCQRVTHISLETTSLKQPGGKHLNDSYQKNLLNTTDQHFFFFLPFHTKPHLTAVWGYLCFTPNLSSLLYGAICDSHQTSAHRRMGLSVFHTKPLLTAVWGYLCFTPNLCSLLYGAICVSHQTSAHCCMGLSVFHTKLHLNITPHLSSLYGAICVSHQTSSVFHTKLHLCFTPNLSSLLHGAICVSHQTSSVFHTKLQLIAI